MGLVEFLRQWQGGRMAGGVALSVLLHLLLGAAALWGPPPFPPLTVKRGEPFMVELPAGPESPPPGRPGASPAVPVPQPARKAPPGPSLAARPAPPRPEPRLAPAREPRAARVPVARAPDGDAPTLPAPEAPESSPKAAEPLSRPQEMAAKAPEPPPLDPPAPTPPAPEATTAAPAPEIAQRAAPTQPQLASVPPAPGPRAVPDIRSLGRAGGAGGSGAGRAGIEGEPIPLDSADPRYSDYLDQVRRRIKDKWGYPCVKNDRTRQCEYKTVQLIIEFGIAKNGTVPFITVVRSSGFPIYDDYAVNAVKLADFPPIPDTFSRTGVPILATFSYVVQSSLTNLLR